MPEPQPAPRGSVQEPGEPEHKQKVQVQNVRFRFAPGFISKNATFRLNFFFYKTMKTFPSNIPKKGNTLQIISKQLLLSTASTFASASGRLEVYILSSVLNYTYICLQIDYITTTSSPTQSPIFRHVTTPTLPRRNITNTTESHNRMPQQVARSPHHRQHQLPRRFSISPCPCVTTKIKKHQRSRAGWQS